MVQMLKHIIENSKFPIFLLPIHDCRNKTLGNNIHSSQYHRSFCKQILGLKFCRLWCLRGALLRSELVVSILGNIPNPRESLIAALLNYLQVANLDSRSGEIWNLKFYTNGRFSFLIFSFNTWKSKVSSHQVFFSTWKRFNGPDNFTVLWNPFDTSNSGFKLWRVRIIWNRNVNLHIVGS